MRDAGTSRTLAEKLLALTNPAPCANPDESPDLAAFSDLHAADSANADEPQQRYDHS